MNGYQKIKKMVAAAATDTLVEAYKQAPITEGSTTEDLLVHNAIESELEARGVIRYNEETWQYDFC